MEERRDQGIADPSAIKRQHEANRDSSHGSIPIALRQGPHGRLVEERVSSRGLSGAERRRLVELLSVGVERGLKKPRVVDLSTKLSVDTRAPEERNR